MTRGRNSSVVSTTSESVVPKLRIAILSSMPQYRAINLDFIYDAIVNHAIPATIKLHITNRIPPRTSLSTIDHNSVLDWTDGEGIKHRILHTKNVSAIDYDCQIADLLHGERINLIILMGYSRELTSDFKRIWGDKTIIVTHNLEPAENNRQYMSDYREILESGAKLYSCTVHRLNEEHTILSQESRVFSPDNRPNVDPLHDLQNKVCELEKVTLIEALSRCSKLLIERRRKEEASAASSFSHLPQLTM